MDSFKKHEGIGSFLIESKEQIMPLEFMQLLIFKINHDISGPVTVISGGLELLDSREKDEVLELMLASSEYLTSCLRLFRAAYGPNPGDTISLSNFIPSLEKYCDYKQTKCFLDVDLKKITGNLVPICLNIIISIIEVVTANGSLYVTTKTSDPNCLFECKINNVEISAHRTKILSIMAKKSDLNIDLSSIQAYYTAILSSCSGIKINVATGQNSILISAAKHKDASYVI